MTAATTTVGARRRRRAPRFALALPSWIWYLGFFLVPAAVIFWYSLGYKPPVVSGQGPIGLDRLTFDNYSEALTGTFFSTFRNTLQVALIGTLACLTIGFPVAYWIAVKVSPRWRGLLLGLIIVPFWTSFLVRTLAWRIILANQGPVSNLLIDVGLRDSGFQVLDTRVAVQLGVVYNYLPLMIFPLFVALDRLDPALREASKDLGAGRWKTFAQVTLPIASPGVVAGLLLVFIPLSGDYITAALLGGAKGNMAGAMVASQFLAAQNWALGSAMAIVLIAMILATIAVVALVTLVARTVVRRRRHVEVAQPPPAPVRLVPAAEGSRA